MRLIFFIFSMLLIISCATQDTNIDMNPWVFKSIDKGQLQRIDHMDISRKTLNNIYTNYKKHPGQFPSFTELTLYAAYEDTAKDTTILMFYILYVSDIAVVYVIGEDGNILSKHLRSSWGLTAEDI